MLLIVVTISGSPCGGLSTSALGVVTTGILVEGAVETAETGGGIPTPKAAGLVGIAAEGGQGAPVLTRTGKGGKLERCAMGVPAPPLAVVMGTPPIWDGLGGGACGRVMGW